jgi:hypothetical protein
MPQPRNRQRRPSQHLRVLDEVELLEPEEVHEEEPEVELRREVDLHVEEEDVESSLILSSSVVSLRNRYLPSIFSYRWMFVQSHFRNHPGPPESLSRVQPASQLNT